MKTGENLQLEFGENINTEYVYPNVLKTYNKDVEIIDLMPKGESAIIRFVRSNRPLKVMIKPFFNYGLYKPIIEENRKGYRFYTLTEGTVLQLYQRRT